MNIELGPGTGPDEQTRWRAPLKVDGRVVGDVLYARWPGFLIIHELPSASSDEQIAAVQALLGDDLGENSHIVHYEVKSIPLLRWYQKGRFGEGIVLSGYWESTSFSWDPIHNIDLDQLPPSVEAASCSIVVTHNPVIREVCSVPCPTLDDVWRWLMVCDYPARMAALRRLALDSSLSPALVDAGHQLALLNESYGIRQFATLHYGGFAGSPLVSVPFDTLRVLLADPGRVLAPFGRSLAEHPAADAAQARRNIRYAVAWTLGNARISAISAPPTAWASQVSELCRRELDTEAEVWTTERDIFIADLVSRELMGSEAVDRFAFGAPTALGVLDFVRYALMRRAWVEESGLLGQDRFHWLADTANALLGDQDSAAARVARSPRPLPLPGLSGMPEWLYGQNHHTA